MSLIEMNELVITDYIKTQYKILENTSVFLSF